MPMTAGFSKHDKTKPNGRSFSHFSKHVVLTKNRKSKISLCWLQKTAFWNKSHSAPEFLWTPCSLEIKNSLLIYDNCVLWESYLCCSFTHVSSWCLGTQFSVTDLQILKKTELWKLGCLHHLGDLWNRAVKTHLQHESPMEDSCDLWAKKLVSHFYLALIFRFELLFCFFSYKTHFLSLFNWQCNLELHEIVTWFSFSNQYMPLMIVK